MNIDVDDVDKAVDFYECGLGLQDLDGAVHRARASCAADEGGIRTFPWGRLVTLSDPFGHGFCDTGAVFNELYRHLTDESADLRSTTRWALEQISRFSE
ncbi:MAG: hypothetical protein Q7J47_10985 [Azoarcus sp.]|nr:hypothetical protein [Azoarcus sp.]